MFALAYNLNIKMQMHVLSSIVLLLFFFKFSFAQTSPNSPNKVTPVYHWIDLTPNHKNQIENCGDCHTAIYEQWIEAFNNLTKYQFGEFWRIAADWLIDYCFRKISNKLIPLDFIVE